MTVLDFTFIGLQALCEVSYKNHIFDSLTLFVLGVPQTTLRLSDFLGLTGLRKTDTHFHSSVRTQTEINKGKRCMG